MRTTLRVDDDLLAELKRRARAENLSITKLVNRVLRRGLAAAQPRSNARSRLRERTFSMGRPRIDLDKSLALAASLEDEAIVEKMSMRK